MRKIVAACVATVSLSAVGSAFADADLFKKSNCMACHNVDQKRWGPTLKDIAAKYSDDSTAAAMLAKKIQAGGAGAWGQMPMPPQPQVSDEDAKKLAEYILSLK